jgi:hypothetical protein
MLINLLLYAPLISFLLIFDPPLFRSCSVPALLS